MRVSHVVAGLLGGLLASGCPSPSDVRVWEWCWESVGARGVNQDGELEFVIWPNISFAKGCVQFCEESSHRIMINGEAGVLTPNTGAFFFWENARNAARGEILAGCSARANQLNLAFTNAAGVVTCEEAIDDLNDVFFLRTAVLGNTDCMSNPIDTDGGLCTIVKPPRVHSSSFTWLRRRLMKTRI